MEKFSALLTICAGNSPVTGEFPSQRPVTRSFDVFLDLRPNERLSKQSWGWWFETTSHPLWLTVMVYVRIDPHHVIQVHFTGTDRGNHTHFRITIEYNREEYGYEYELFIARISQWYIEVQKWSISTERPMPSWFLELPLRHINFFCLFLSFQRI